MTSPSPDRNAKNRRPAGDTGSELFIRSASAYAAIDLGTNNCRMLVARPFKDSFRVVDSFSRIVRLGEGVAAEGRLQEDAIKRTVNALKVCHAKIKQSGARRLRSVATEACRRAENGEEFIGRVKDEACLDLETISPQEEAELTLTGCLVIHETGQVSGKIRYTDIEIAKGGRLSGDIDALEVSLKGRLRGEGPKLAHSSDAPDQQSKTQAGTAGSKAG